MMIWCKEFIGIVEIPIHWRSLKSANVAWPSHPCWQKVQEWPINTGPQKAADK